MSINRSELFKLAHKGVKEYLESHPNCDYSYKFLFSHALKRARVVLKKQCQQEQAAPEIAKLAELIGDADGRKRTNIVIAYVKNFIETNTDLSKYVNRYASRTLPKYCAESKEVRIYANVYHTQDFYDVCNKLNLILNRFDYCCGAY